MRQTTVFLLCGRMFSGKSTLAESIKRVIEKIHPEERVLIHGFSFGVKKVAYDAFGWDGVKDAKGRRLLQAVGTEAGREYNENIWAEKAYKFVVDHKPSVIIFDDCRFLNEISIWKDKPEIEQVITIRCFRDEEGYSNHPSETSLPDHSCVGFYDYVFNNNIDISLLDKKVEYMLRYGV